MSNFETFVTAKNKINELKKELKNKTKKVFREGADAIFNKYPDLVSFEFSMYTPYWNDGDACTFRVLTEYPVIVVKQNGKNITYDLDSEYDEADSKEIENIFDSLEKELFKHFDKDDYMEMFGDHATVTVTREKMSVTRCEHD